MRALTRTAVLLNPSEVPELVALLAEDDAVLMEAVDSHPARRSLVRYSGQRLDGELVYAEYADFFYGVTHVRVASDSTIRTLIHSATPAFIEAFIAGHQRPRYALIDMGLPNVDPTALDVNVASNYLVKNLWHNLVHVLLQGINELNYHAFKGAARDRSDFTADNLATILLALSYGRVVRADSIESTSRHDKSIVHVLRRNRSNRMFVIRALATDETEDPAELDWRTRRSLAVYISGWLVASGRAASALAVEFGRDHGQGPTIVVEVNGCHIATPFTKQLAPGDSASEDQRTAFKNLQRQVAIFVDANYRSMLADPARQTYARDTLTRTLECMGVVSSMTV